MIIIAVAPCSYPPPPTCHPQNKTPLTRREPYAGTRNLRISNSNLTNPRIPAQTTPRRSRQILNQTTANHPHSRLARTNNNNNRNTHPDKRNSPGNRASLLSTGFNGNSQGQGDRGGRPIRTAFAVHVPFPNDDKTADKIDSVNARILRLSRTKGQSSHLCRPISRDQGLSR